MAMEIVVDDLGNDADAEEEGFEDDDVEEEETQESGGAARAASMPGTPDHAAAAAAAAAAAGKEYASESEAAWMVGGRRQGNHHHQQQQQRRRRRRTMSAQRRRENWVERAWEMRRSVMRDRNENRNRRVLVPPPEEDEEDRRAEWMRMDLEEVQACRDLGLGLPPAWTLELPYGLSGGETSSGGNSPCGSWRISSPGDDPREVKARLKAWAQAVVLASASHLQN